MNGEKTQHTCPGCGLHFTAEAVGPVRDEKLELTWDPTGTATESDDERLNKRIDELREQWRREYEAERAAAGEGPANSTKGKSSGFLDIL